MSERAVPFHCPYCGEQDLWPFETPRSSAPQEAPSKEAQAAWECRGCLRAFTVRMLGMVRPSTVVEP